MTHALSLVSQTWGELDQGLPQDRKQVLCMQRP